LISAAKGLGMMMRGAKTFSGESPISGISQTEHEGGGPDIRPDHVGPA
jgi:hypothetical protein